MTITKMIETLEAIREVEGDIRVTVFDECAAEEGVDYGSENLWKDAKAVAEMVLDDDCKEIEKVVCIY